MRYLRFAAMCLVTAAFPGSTRGDQTTGDKPLPADTQGAIWRTTRNCGVNCVYVLLRTNNKTADYSALMSNLMARSGGEMNSLKDLRDAAGERGLRCRIGKTTLDGLDALPKPLVAHLEGATPNTGHFVLVLRSGPDFVDILDGTTGSVTTITTRDFTQSWTGYVMHVAPPWYATVPAWAAAALVLAAGVAVASAVDRVRRRTPRVVPAPVLV